MSSIWLIVIVLIIFAAIFLGIDFTRFVKAVGKEKKDELNGVKVDAGGVLFVQGNRTYYQMPNGERRKIADYAMDLTPGSRDMNMFTATLDQARKLHATEQRNVRKEAKQAMEKLAADVVSCETEESNGKR